MVEAGPSRRAEVRALLQAQKATEGELEALYHFIESYPKYAWVKRWDEDTGLYTMLRYSKRYGLDLVGHDRGVYIGKTDFEFWPNEIAQVFFANDERVRLGMLNPQHPTMADVSETFSSPVTGVTSVFVGEKWAFEAGGEIYVAGRGWGDNRATKTQ